MEKDRGAAETAFDASKASQQFVDWVDEYLLYGFVDADDRGG